MVMRATNRRRLAGFTLIELLVVIAIIALLIGILLPALGRARTAGQLAVSLSNNRQISLATEQYRSDNDGFMPWYQLASPQWIGFCPWAYGGNHPSGEWRNQFSNLFNVSAHERPLNKYIYADFDWDPEAAGLIGPQTVADPATGRTQVRWYPRPTSRDNLDLPVFRSPADKTEYVWLLLRQNGSPVTLSPEPNEFGESSYRFNGTSYMTNLKWWQLIRSLNADFSEAFRRGMSRFRTGADFNPSQFVTLTDEVGVPISWYGAQNNGGGLENGFGDLNRSVMSFFDGHASYKQMEFGAFRTPEYNFVFYNPGERERLEELEEDYTSTSN